MDTHKQQQDEQTTTDRLDTLQDSTLIEDLNRMEYPMMPDTLPSSFEFSRNTLMGEKKMTTIVLSQMSTNPYRVMTITVNITMMMMMMAMLIKHPNYILRSNTTHH